MQVFIDESGSFTGGPTGRDYCGVGALAIPDSEIAALEARCKSLCQKFGVDELKGRSLNESEIGQVLRALSAKNALLEVVFIDSAHASDPEVRTFVDRATAHVESMADQCVHETMRQEWRTLAEEIRALPIQLVRQVYTVPYAVAALIRTAVPFFAKRRPNELARFSWTYDSKGPVGSTGGFDGLLRRWMMPVLQAEFAAYPLINVGEFDYSHMERLRIRSADIPSSLPAPRPETAIPGGDADGFDLGRMVRDNLVFTTSDASPGLQFADVAVNAIRRAIRGNLQRPGWVDAAQLLAWDREPPIRFICLDPDGEGGTELTEASPEVRGILSDLRSGAHRVFE